MRKAWPSLRRKTSRLYEACEKNSRIGSSANDLCLVSIYYDQHTPRRLRPGEVLLTAPLRYLLPCAGHRVATRGRMHHRPAPRSTVQSRGAAAGNRQDLRSSHPPARARVVGSHCGSYSALPTVRARGCEKPAGSALSASRSPMNGPRALCCTPTTGTAHGPLPPAQGEGRLENREQDLQ